MDDPTAKFSHVEYGTDVNRCPLVAGHKEATISLSASSARCHEHASQRLRSMARALYTVVTYGRTMGSTNSLTTSLTRFINSSRSDDSIVVM